MNDGSSRSHCAITLTLLTHDTSAKSFKETTFSIVDLAGAERPEKALGTRISKDKALIELWKYSTRAPMLPRAASNAAHAAHVHLTTAKVARVHIHT